MKPTPVKKITPGDHPADKYNNGKCALHVTIDQARGAWAQQIDKEERCVEKAKIRMKAVQLGIRCPRCGESVTCSKCGVCGYTGITLPSLTPEPTPPEYRSNSYLRNQMAPSESSEVTKHRHAETKKKLENLQNMLMEEKEGRAKLEKQISEIKSLVERL
eukprot:PhF_6_TR18699/c0_g1_i1/m.27329